MRRFLIPLLMAGTLMPAAANADPGDRVVRERSERAQKSDDSSKDRPQRAERGERSNNDAPRVRAERTERPARVERSVDTQASEPVRVRPIGRQQVTEPVQEVGQVDRRDDHNDGFVGAIRQIGSDEAARRRGEAVVDRHRDGDRDWSRDRDHDHRWSRDWRRDHRYNWHSHRDRYGSLFRLGRYYDPYGWGYRRFSIGFSLWPSYYGSNYWLNDPWRYRLPPAYGPYRWVRYYDDALLVNIYTGQVVDVIYNFFW